MHYRLVVMNEGSHFDADGNDWPFFFHGIHVGYMLTADELHELRSRGSLRGHPNVDTGSQPDIPSGD